MGNRKHLYHARINSRLSLEQIGLRTALSPSVLRHIDEGRFELLPSGVYARSYVRAFANAVGLDPDEALAEVEPLLPGVPDAIAVMHEAHAVTPWERACRQFSSVSERLAERIPALVPTFRPGAVQQRLARLSGPVSREEALASPTFDGWQMPWFKQRWGAAAIDATLLVVVDAFLVMLISWSSGIAVEVLLQDSGLALAAFCAVPIGLYFVLFGGIAGSTLGQSACHLIDRRTGPPLTLPEILRRAFEH